MRVIKYFPTGVKPNIGIKRFLWSFCIYAYTFVNCVLVFLHSLLPAGKRAPKYKVSLCLIFKNEAKYLREWIEYHKLIGVEHFYLYNNFSDDNFKDILKPYIDSNEVTLIDWPYQYAQIKAYEDAYKRFKDETQWIGFIDADEFVNIQRHDNIVTLLERYRRFPAVFFHWRMFGTSGHQEYDDRLLITERFTSCWEDLTDVGKSFVNTDYTLSKINPHYAEMKFCGLPVFSVGLNKVPNIKFKTLCSVNAGKYGYINHYWSKSFSEYFYKDFSKGEVSSSQNEKIKQQKGRFEYHELHNSRRDYSIQRWLVFLKQRLDGDK